MKHGILSHSQAKLVQHDSVAMPEIQEKRQNKQIPGARLLHEYANLYFDAHNPMLSKLRAHNDSICILRINTAVLDIAGAIIADRNAASKWARFNPSPAGLTLLNKDMVFTKYWTSRNEFQEWEQKAVKCAEVLVPDTVDPKFIIGVYVANQTALTALQALNLNLPAAVKSDIFF